MFKNRIELVKLILPGSVGVELGVAKGLFSNELLQEGKEDEKVSLLFSIDRWSDHHGEDEYKEACKLLHKWGGRSRIMRAPFTKCLTYFKDAYFDFIYIDGYAHNGQEGGATLRDWYPKLKSGGLFAGHDYDPQFPQTMRAVNDFAKEHKLGLNFTQETGNMEWPSWYTFKP